MQEEVSQGQAIAIWAAANVVVPASIMALFGALLHFLLDLRAVWLGGGAGLKWSGTLFIVAVVLIVRYGRVYGQAGRQAGYIGLLAVVMGMSMFSLYEVGGVLPAGWSAALAFPTLAGAVGLVWWLAASTTRALDLDLRPPATPPPLYGEALMRHEAWKRGDPWPPPREEGAVTAPGEPQPLALRVMLTIWEGLTGTGEIDRGREPVVAVGRLALPALLIFALGEPLLLSAPPEVGARAALAMVVAYLSAGLLLSAGGALSVFWRVRDRGGRAHPMLIPVRAGVGAALVGVALVMALGAPGVNFEGTGERAIPEVRGGGSLRPGPKSEQGDYSGGGDQPGEGQTGEGGDAGEGSGEGAGDGAGEGGQGDGGEGSQTDSSSPRGSTAGAAGQLVGGLAALGQKLFMVLAALVAMAVVFFTFQTLPHWGGWASQLAAWLRALRPERPAAAPPRGPPPGPRGGGGSRGRLAIYRRLEALAQARGCERPERWTASEFAARLPAPLRPATAEIRELTALYNRAAYAPGAVGEADRARGVEALRQAVRKTG